MIKDKVGNLIEPIYDKSIEILYDEEEKTSSGIFIKGGIPIEGADGTLYEERNRLVLCRCGNSKNKPFCDGEHLNIK